MGRNWPVWPEKCLHRPRLAPVRASLEMCRPRPALEGRVPLEAAPTPTCSTAVPAVTCSARATAQPTLFAAAPTGNRGDHDLASADHIDTVDADCEQVLLPKLRRIDRPRCRARGVRLQSGVRRSPARIVPPRITSARRPPRCTSGSRTPPPLRRSRWAHGWHSRRPRQRASPSVNSRPTRALMSFLARRRCGGGRLRGRTSPGRRRRRASARSPAGRRRTSRSHPRSDHPRAPAPRWRAPPQRSARALGRPSEDQRLHDADAGVTRADRRPYREVQWRDDEAVYGFSSAVTAGSQRTPDGTPNITTARGPLPSLAGRRAIHGPAQLNVCRGRPGPAEPPFGQPCPLLLWIERDVVGRGAGDVRDAGRERRALSVTRAHGVKGLAAGQAIV